MQSTRNRLSMMFLTAVRSCEKHDTLSLCRRSALQVYANYKESRLRNMMNGLGIHNTRLLDLLSAMLQLDPMRRITASRALENEYFRCLKRPIASINETRSTGKKKRSS